MRGAFIVIEGLDRSGKSTQCALLQSHISGLGRPVELLKFPDRTTPIGQMIDAYLRSHSLELDDRAIHLLFSANRWEAAAHIHQLLAAGTTVVADRYAFSGAAFSASKTPPLPLEWCKSPDAGLPAPDLVVFLDIAPEAAALRGGYGEERYEKREMQERVRGKFKRVAESVEGWVELDAGRGLEEVKEEIWGWVEPLVGGVGGEVRRLWVDGAGS